MEKFNQNMLNELSELYYHYETEIIDMVQDIYDIDLETLDHEEFDNLTYHLGLMGINDRLDVYESEAIKIAKESLLPSQWEELDEEQKTDMIMNENYYLSTNIDIDIQIALVTMYLKRKNS